MCIRDSNGSWNATNPTNICGNELTSFLTIAAADNGDYSFAQVVYDSLAFANYANTSVYSLPMAGSTITLDSVGMFKMCIRDRGNPAMG